MLTFSASLLLLTGAHAAGGNLFKHDALPSGDALMSSELEETRNLTDVKKAWLTYVAAAVVVIDVAAAIFLGLYMSTKYIPDTHTSKVAVASSGIAASALSVFYNTNVLLTGYQGSAQPEKDSAQSEKAQSEKDSAQSVKGFFGFIYTNTQAQTAAAAILLNIASIALFIVRLVGVFLKQITKVISCGVAIGGFLMTVYKAIPHLTTLYEKITGKKITGTR